ncbi:hypothetical protein NQ314_019591 [Rhamnusium bicolor]|uniref:G-protein coupled receptors family 1 profile domain-containing protein n=1 Tax=Rhamnusium bicolor TaxID=1586634 RepID=A0AAV8WNE6_9CUCU|nr:hypothetical protein NQ314_019591 [Rhamnusium bicolor]
MYIGSNNGKEGYSRKISAEKKRFIYYCIYACGLPVLHTLIVFLINTYGDQNASYYPGVGVHKCYLDGRNIINIIITCAL